MPYLAWRGDIDLYAPPDDGDEPPYPLAPGFLAALEDRAAAAAAAIPVEQIDGALLLLSGEDDQMRPSALYAELVVRLLTERGHSHPYHHVSYHGAGHLLDDPPNLPTTVAHARHTVIGREFPLRGLPERRQQPTGTRGRRNWRSCIRLLLGCSRISWSRSSRCDEADLSGLLVGDCKLCCLPPIPGSRWRTPGGLGDHETQIGVDPPGRLARRPLRFLPWHRGQPSGRCAR
jgi:hypothetical protein